MSAQRLINHDAIYARLKGFSPAVASEAAALDFKLQLVMMDLPGKPAFASKPEARAHAKRASGGRSKGARSFTMPPKEKGERKPPLAQNTIIINCLSIFIFIFILAFLHLFFFFADFDCSPNNSIKSAQNRLAGKQLAANRSDLMRTDKLAPLWPAKPVGFD